jgi:hypothetical protein
MKDTVMQPFREIALFLHRRGQQWGAILLLSLAVCLTFLGVYALHLAPTPLLDSRFFFPTEGTIERFDDIKLEANFFLRLPEFFTPSAERVWWRQQAMVYKTLKAKQNVTVVLVAKDGTTKQDQVAISFLPLIDVFKRTGLIYLVALIYLASAVQVFQRHRTQPGTILTFFFREFCPSNVEILLTY